MQYTTANMKTITEEDAILHFDQMLSDVENLNESYIITRNGIAVAVLLSVKDYAELALATEQEE